MRERRAAPAAREARRSSIVVAVLVASCGGTPAPPPEPQTTPQPPVVASASASSPSPAEPPTPAALEAILRPVLAPGAEIHAGPIALDDGSVVAWIGVGTSTDARVRLEQGATKASLDPLPPGVRAVEAFRHGAAAVALLESLAVLDLPAGLRGVDAFPAAPLEPTELVALSRLPSRAAARAWLLARRESAAITLPEMKQLFAASTPAASRLTSTGVKILRTWSGLFAAEVPRPSGGPASAVARLGTDCVDASCCAGGTTTCTVGWEQGGMRIHVTREAGAPRIDALVMSEDAAAPLEHPASARKVTASGDKKATVAALARLGLRGEVLAEAPLFADAASTATLGIVRTRDGETTDVIAIEQEPNLTRALTFMGSTFAPTSLQIGFADLDGDGRTDVVMGGLPVLGAEPPRSRKVSFQGFVSPRALGVTSVAPDATAGLAMARATTLARALDAATALATGGIPRAEACPLLVALGRRATASKAFAPGAVLFTYTEPGQFSASVRPGSLADVTTPEGRFGACDVFECDPSRPVCWFDKNAPELDWFVMQRDRRGAVRIVAAAMYTGS